MNGWEASMSTASSEGVFDAWKMQVSFESESLGSPAETQHVFKLISAIGQTPKVFALIHSVKQLGSSRKE